ncbi:MAG TPA: hypothetical protein VHI93_07620, partial [Candidatus Thermoplasmatota archaeon]|nr:hypothetical protein [Candidatus Thermoplasmatota archaeon]
MPSTLAVSALAAALLAAGLVPTPADAADPPQRLIVHFDTLPPGLQAHGSYAGARVLAVDATLGFAAVQAPNGEAFRAAARGRPEVRAVEPDGISHSLGLTPNDPLFAGQYGPQ